MEGFVSNDVFCMGDLTVKGMDFAEAVKEPGLAFAFGKLVALFGPLDPSLTRYLDSMVSSVSHTILSLSVTSSRHSITS